MSKRKSLLDYGATIGITALTSVSMLIVVGWMARALDKDEFTLYSVVTRYLGFVVAISGMALSFAFIRVSNEGDKTRTLQAAATARTLIVAVTGLLSLPFFLALAVVHWRGIAEVDWLLPLAYVWVLSQASFSLSNPYARFRGGVPGYARLYLIAKVAAVLLGGAGAALTGEFEAFFITVGVVSLSFQAWLWRDVQLAPLASLDTLLAKNMFGFSASRWLDQLLRLSFPVVLITASQILISSAVAGSIAVVYLVAKSMESVLQPLVVAVMMRNVGRKDVNRGVWMAWLFAVLITLGVFFGRPLVESAFALYLGPSFLDLVPAAWIVLLSAGSLISLNFLRALNDNRFRVSPMLSVNVICVVLLPVGVAFCDSVDTVAVLIAGLHISRFLLYTVVIGRLPAQPVDLGRTAPEL